MKDSWTDYPITVIAWAMQSLFGRLLVVILTLLLASGIGCFLVDFLMADFIEGLIFYPLMALPSLLVSVGLFVLPITLIFACMFIIHEWPKWTLLLPFIFNIWLSYDYTDYVRYRSPMAKIEREMIESIEKGIREAAEAEKRKARRKSSEGTAAEASNEES